MSELFLYKEDEWKECLSRMGFFLGKYIYIIDAYEDIEKDLKRGITILLKKFIKMKTLIIL